MENGRIQYPVTEITVAGNLRDMYLGIARFYEQIAAAMASPKPGDAIAQLKDFCAERGEAKRKSA